MDFNQYGLIVLGESNDSRDYELVAIKDNGETQRLDSRLIEGEYLFTDDGYFCSNAAESENTAQDMAGSVSFYDYAGNLKGTYPMEGNALLEQGYDLKKLTFNEGKLAGFYVQRDTGELYIVTIHGSGAAHSNDSGRYANFASQKSPLTYESCSHGTRSKCAFLTREK